MTRIIPLSADALESVPQRVKPTHEKIPIGLDERGNIVWLPYHSNNMLIAGMPGTGKSGTQTNIICQIAQIPNAALIVLDALVVEAKQFEKRASFISRGRCCGDIVSRLVHEEGERRIARMLREGRESDGTPRKITPDRAAEFPTITIVVDEAAAQFNDVEDEKHNSGITNDTYKYVKMIVAEQRKFGHNIILATQRPDNTTVPTQLRNIINQRIVHGLDRPSDVDMILGSGKSELAPAHNLTTKQLGVGYLLSSEDRANPLLFRSSLIFNNAERAAVFNNPNASEAMKDIAVNSPTVEEIMSATEHLRVPLPFLDNNADLQQHLAEHDEREAELLAQQDEIDRRAAKARAEREAAENVARLAAAQSY